MGRTASPWGGMDFARLPQGFRQRLRQASVDRVAASQALALAPLAELPGPGAPATAVGQPAPGTPAPGPRRAPATPGYESGRAPCTPAVATGQPGPSTPRPCPSTPRAPGEQGADRWDFPTRPIPRRASLSQALLAASDKEAAMGAYGNDTLSATTRSARDAKVKTWAALHNEWFGVDVPLLPLTVTRCALSCACSSEEATQAVRPTCLQ